MWRWLLGQDQTDAAASAEKPDALGSRESPDRTDSSRDRVGLMEPSARVESGSVSAVSGAIAAGDAQPALLALERAAAAQSRLADAADQLAPALNGLPVLVQHQSRATEAILQLTAQARERDALLAKSLEEFHQGAERQTQLLRLIQQQLDLTHITNTSVAEGLRDASIALGAYAGTSERHTRAIESLLEATRRRTRRADEMERSLQTWMIITTGLCTACLVYSLYLAYRSGSASTPATPAVILTGDGGDTALDGSGTQLATSTPLDEGAAAAGSGEATTEATGDAGPDESPAEEGRDKPPAAPLATTGTGGATSSIRPGATTSAPTPTSGGAGGAPKRP